MGWFSPFVARESRVTGKKRCSIQIVYILLREKSRYRSNAERKMQRNTKRKEKEIKASYTRNPCFWRGLSPFLLILARRNCVQNEVIVCPSMTGARSNSANAFESKGREGLGKMRPDRTLGTIITWVSVFSSLARKLMTSDQSSRGRKSGCQSVMTFLRGRTVRHDGI